MTRNDITVRSICTQWVSDGIGEDFKNWTIHCPPVSASRVFLESQTGTGKTSFILDRLFPYAAEMGRSILYLGNRTALEEQTKYAVKKRLTPISEEDSSCSETEFSEIRTFQYPGHHSTITILNYQSVLGFTKQLGNGPLFPQNPFYYVILDEAHFFLEDALFNPMTWKILERIMRRFYHSVLLFMSATMEESVTPLLTVLDMFHPAHPQELIYNTHYYNKNETFYINSYQGGNYRPGFFRKYDELIAKIKERPQEEKWLLFVSSKQEGRDLEKKLREQTGRSVRFLSSEHKTGMAWNRLVNESRYKEHILIVTKVLDNGVNIIDSAVKHIVLPFCDHVDFLQMLGRRRREEGETLFIYAQVPIIQAVNSQLRQIRKLERAMEPFLYSKPSADAMTHLLQDYWMSGDQAVNNLFYIDHNRDLVLNPLACWKVELLKEYYCSMTECCDPSLYYPYLVCIWLGIELTDLPVYIGIDSFDSLTDLLAAHLESPIPPEQQERFYQNFQYYYKRACISRFGEKTPELKCALSIRKGKTQRKLTINRSLDILKLPYQIVKRNRCWVLEPLAEPKP